MNRKLAFRYFTVAFMAATFFSNLIWAETSAVQAIRPKVTASIHPSSRVIFDENSQNAVHQENAWFMGAVSQLAARKYAELSRFLPVPEDRSTDTAFKIIFKGNDKNTVNTKADVYGSEVRIYDNYMDIPLDDRSIGLIVHEVAHFLQAPYRDYVPHWMMEAISDYFRYSYQEEQNIYWFLATTRKKLDNMKSEIINLEKAVEQGKPGAYKELERARKALVDFKDIGYRDNPGEPVHSAGLLALIDDFEQSRKDIRYGERNYKSALKSKDTGKHGETRYYLEVEVRKKALENKLFYVSKVADSKGNDTFIIDANGPSPESKVTFVVTTVYEKVQQELDTIEKEGEDYYPDIPDNLFITDLHKQIYASSSQGHGFNREDFDYYLSSSIGVSLSSFWNEYIARAEANPVPVIDAFAIDVVKYQGRSWDSLSDDEHEEYENLRLIAKRAAQTEYIEEGEKIAVEYAKKHHSWVVPYGVRIQKNLWDLLDYFN